MGVTDEVDVIILLGGIFDGAEGPAPNHAGRPSIWVRVSPNRSDRLSISNAHRGPDSYRYVLTSRCPRGYIYSSGDGSGSFLENTYQERPIGNRTVAA